MPNSFLLNSNLWYMPVSDRNCWMKATAVSVIGQKLQCCQCIYSEYEWTPRKFFNNYLDTGFFWVAWGQAYFPSRKKMWEQNERLDQNFFSGTVKRLCAGGHLQSQYVVHSLFDSSTNGWTHQVGCPQLPCREFCVKQQQIDLELIASWAILKTVQSGSCSLRMLWV